MELNNDNFDQQDKLKILSGQKKEVLRHITKLIVTMENNRKTDAYRIQIDHSKFS